VAFAQCRQFFNPVLEDNVPDPGVLKTNGVYYAVTTTNDGNGNKFAIHMSQDLQNWGSAGFVFNDQTRPGWALRNDAFWAPELHQIGNRFYVYFTARDAGNNALAVGVASSDNVLGPYRDVGYPLISNPGMGSIDATLIRSADDIYLVWKDDGNAIGQPTWIWARRLNGDGLSFATDEQIGLFREDLPWEGNLVEGVWHVERNGMHYLFYSGNGYCGDSYAVGVARSNNALGPYEKRRDPILVSDNDFKGPGHCSVVRDMNDEDWVMVYHAWHRDRVCGNNPRVMLSKSIAWGGDGWPYITD